MRYCLSLLLLLALLTVAPIAVEAAGGTNGLLGRMETMVTQLERSGEMDKEEAQKMRKKIKELRAKVQARIQENGGWLNTQHDRDIYAEIDQYNKPLFQRYQKSKAKKGNPSTSLGVSPNDEDYYKRYQK